MQIKCTYLTYKHKQTKSKFMIVVKEDILQLKQKFQKLIDFQNFKNFKKQKIQQKPNQ